MRLLVGVTRIRKTNMTLNTNGARSRGVAILAVGVLILTLVVIAINMGRADAISAKDDACTPQAAYTETIVITPAVPEVPGTPAVPPVTETVHHDATADLWWNWSPNDTKGPQDYEPAFPFDERGTWQGPHENGGPEQGTYGTFNTSNNDNGNSSWFHREKGLDAYDEVIVVTPGVDAVPGTPAVPAVTQTVEHAAVTCDTPSETPTVTPTVTPEPPVVEPEEPNQPESTGVQVVCRNGQFVTIRNGHVVARSGSCDNDTQVAETPAPATEEGL